MGNTIQENLFEAIDLLIEKKMHEVSFDTTITGEIIDITNASKNEYIIKSETLTFKAYSIGDKKYPRGIKVYVMIPQGNYNLQKIILGESQSAVLDGKKMLRPLDSLIPIGSKNWAEDELKSNIILNSLNSSADVFKDDEDKRKDIAINNINSDLKGQKFIGLQAEFQTYMPNVKAGSYGLILYINGQPYGILDSSEFYGNPYMYDGGFKIEKLFTLPEDIREINLKFYAKDDFEFYNDDESINIILKDNLKIVIGYNELIDEEDKVITEPTLDLYLEDDNKLEYKTDNPQEIRKIRAWFIENNISYFINNELPSGYELRWFVYQPGAANTFELAGPGWIEIEDNKNKFTYSYTFDTKFSERRIKALVVQGKTLIAEKGLIFTNMSSQKSEEQIKTESLMLIKVNDSINHSGVFNIFGSDNEIVIGEITNITLSYDFNDGVSKPSNNDEVEWVYPNLEGQTNSLFSFKKEDKKLILTINNNATKNSFLSNGFEINCQVKQNGILYEAKKTLTFGYIKTQGTNFALNAQIITENLTDFVFTSKVSSIQFKPIVTDENGNDITANATDIKANIEGYGTNPSSPFTLSEDEDEKKYTITYDNSKFSKGSFGTIVLTANITNTNGVKVSLKTLIPIGITSLNAIPLVSGPQTIMYKQLGGYEIGTSSYPNTLEDTEVNWSLAYYNDSATKPYSIENNQLQIVDIRRTTTPVSIVAKSEGNIIWTKPLLIKQEAYRSQWLNDWNGTLTIDDEDNYIFSSLLGAGKKETDNSFTGILLGDVGTTLESAKTGLYGFNQGKKVFELDAETGDGEIGGWKITPEGIESTIQNYYLKAVNINTDNPVININNVFKVDGLGKMYATGGSIGDWALKANFLGNDENNPTIFLSSKGKSATLDVFGTKNCVFYSKGNFAVDTEGKVYVQEGHIGSWILSGVGDDGKSGFLYSQGDLPLYLFGDGDGSAIINGTSLNNLTMRVGKNGSTATFGITSDGKVYGSGVDLSGTLIAAAVKSNREIDAWENGAAYANGFHMLGDIADQGQAGMLIRRNYSGVLINLARVAVFSLDYPESIKNEDNLLIDWSKAENQVDISMTFKYTYYTAIGINTREKTIYINPTSTFLTDTWVLELEKDSETNKEYYYYYDSKGNRTKQFPFELYTYTA